MSELEEYRLQLQQVEAALTLDPDNEDLTKLKTDLQEVINLTSELETKEESSPPSGHTASTAPVGASFDDEDEDAPFHRAAAGAGLAASSSVPEYQWKVGDKCMAIWSHDSASYHATIGDILEDGSCTVTFTQYGNTDVTQVSLLKPVEEEGKGTGAASNKPKSKKELLNDQREYKKRKAEKKRQRQKQLEEEREQEKNKWLSFNSKAFSKTNKGRVKKSIFATPDSVTGRVGVGTCGMSGKGMTKFVGHEKWKK